MYYGLVSGKVILPFWNDTIVECSKKTPLDLSSRVPFLSHVWVQFPYQNRNDSTNQPSNN